MSTRTDCKVGGPTLANGNCTKHGPDDLPVQCVGPWAADKHFYLKKYIDATRAVRAQYLPPKGPGGAAFIDLFAGPGAVRIRDTGETPDGSPLIALHHGDAPFTRLIFCDVDPDNIRALQTRTRDDRERTTIIQGDCNATLDRILEHIPPQGLNIALIDPYNLGNLKFATLRRLAEFTRMDLVIHFPTGDIKRNLGKSDNTQRLLDEALGTTAWSSQISSMTDIAALIEIFKKQLSILGYRSQQVRSEPIKNSQNLPLYYLVYASKSERGDSIWQSITKNKPSGQRGFDF